MPQWDILIGGPDDFICVGTIFAPDTEDESVHVSVKNKYNEWCERWQWRSNYRNFLSWLRHQHGWDVDID